MTLVPLIAAIAGLVALGGGAYWWSKRRSEKWEREHFSWNAYGVRVYDAPETIGLGEEVGDGVLAALVAMEQPPAVLDRLRLFLGTTDIDGKPFTGGRTWGLDMYVNPESVPLEKTDGYVAHETCHALMNKLPGFPKDEAGQHEYMRAKQMAWAPGGEP